MLVSYALAGLGYVSILPDTGLHPVLMYFALAGLLGINNF